MLHENVFILHVIVGLNCVDGPKIILMMENDLLQSL